MERHLSSFFTPLTAAQSAYCGDKTASFSLPADPLVSGLEYDSRKVKPGNLFFALKGLRTDGHNYIGQAVEKKASVVVYQDDINPENFNKETVFLKVKDSRFAMSPIAAAFYGYPSRRMTVIGVTGTEGKSTTVYLIWQLLRLLGKKAGFFSTVQYSLGGDELPNPEHQTTPEATEVQRFLFEIAESGAEYAVAESSSHGLSPRTNRLGDVDFTVAVMTNLTREHLEFHGTWEQYRDDKGNLFRALGRHSESGEYPAPFGVINADDPNAAWFAAETIREVLSYSVNGLEADLSVHSIESSAYGNWYEVLVRGTGETLDVRDKLPGSFNAGNVLAALLVVSRLLSLPVREAAVQVPRLKPLRGRMTSVRNKLGIEILVDFAHTPSSFETIFPPLRRKLKNTGGRIISLFGSAGERDTEKRSGQGRVAAKYSDYIVLTDEDPRGEKPMDILEEIARGCFAPAEGETSPPRGGRPEWKRDGNLFLIPERPKAIRKALSLAKPGDLVLLLGKGHENSIIYADRIVAYDEIREAEKAAAELGETAKAGR
ncbi:MAG: UDP-N-acetylmuramoyl-L-alanyl-D-glutamate--2,6-diaminopimelate ligase [Treponema sp.]|jgi:UDP-N-acetylmuramoyl-L-alanyl-D-glutamate--2,6-diaminopimelate ligase|nr:UDP-N-acetylmuramoyl-L-alanyl-D-glutamate--2,6-diaminopimelate ligase [Treponema sp.]